MIGAGLAPSAIDGLEFVDLSDPHAGQDVVRKTRSAISIGSSLSTCGSSGSTNARIIATRSTGWR